MAAMTQAVKQQLINQCEAYVADRLQRVREVIERAGHDAQAEQKSAMGDKYETGRAAAHLQQENALVQLAEAEKLSASLRLLRLGNAYEQVVPGCLIQSTRHRFFIAIPLGKVSVEGDVYFVISPQAPVGKSLLGKRVGDSFVFQGQTEIITTLA